MKLTYLGHSCFEIQIGGKTLLLDPFVSGNSLADSVDIRKLHPDLILLSHAHQDHVLDAPSIAKQSDATILSNFEICNYLGKHDLQIYPMNHGGTYADGDLRITYVNAVHTSSFEDGTYGGQPGGWVIEGPEKTIYFAGDTDLMQDMELFGKRWSIDICLLPIGGRFTMSYRQVPMACELLGCQTVIGMHYDTFDPIRIDHSIAKNVCEEKGVQLILLEVGGGLSD